MANNSGYEASDILTFDYPMDDELKDDGRLDENGKLDESVNSPKNVQNSDEKKSKSKNGTSSENDADKNSKSDKKSHDKVKSKSSDKKDAPKSKSSSSSVSKSPKDKDKPKEIVSKSKTGTFKIYVSGITEDIKASDLQEVFNKYSNSLDAKIIRFSKIPNECFGLVTIENEQECLKCIQNLNKTLIKGKTILLSQNSPLKKLSKPPVSNTQSDNNVVKSSNSTKKNEVQNESKSKDDKDPSKKETPDKNKDKPKLEKTVEKKSSTVSKSGKDTKKISKNDGNHKANDHKLKEKERTNRKTRSRSRERERPVPSYKIPFKKNVPIKSPLVIEQERLDRIRRERRNRDEMTRIAMERIRYRKEKERLETERMKLRREKLELIRLETEKIAKEREELARQRELVEERKRSEYAAKRFDVRDTRDRSPETYRGQRSNSGPRTFVDSKRYDSRESRSNFKRNKFESNIDNYDNRRHGNNSSNDRDERKEFRRDSREHRFEEPRQVRDRFIEKDSNNGYINSPRPSSFAPSADIRNSWTAQPIAQPQWTTNDRWATTFDTSHPQAAAISPPIVANSVNSMSEMYPNGYSNIPMTGLATASSYVHPPSRRF